MQLDWSPTINLSNILFATIDTQAPAYQTLYKTSTKMKDIDLFVLIAFLVVTLFIMFYLVVFNYLKPNQTEWINGWPQNMHLAEQSIRRGGIVLSWAFGDKDFRVGVVAVLCIFRGV